jgi:hypothetical protein
MSRLSEWVDMQRRLVQHGSGVSILRLKGPDDSTWGTWPIQTENLADTVAATVGMIAEELPKGRHACMLRAYDESGGEVSVLPQSVEGRSSAATSAAAEQLTLQKATSAAIYNANVQNEGLRKQIEHLNDAISTLSENNVTLIDQLQTMAAANADRDLKDARRDAATEMFIAVCGAVKAHAEPLLGLALAKWGPKPALTEGTLDPPTSPSANSPSSPSSAPPAPSPPPVEPIERGKADDRPEATQPSDDVDSDGPPATRPDPSDDRKRSSRDSEHGPARPGPRACASHARARKH